MYNVHTKVRNKNMFTWQSFYHTEDIVLVSSMNPPLPFFYLHPHAFVRHRHGGSVGEVLLQLHLYHSFYYLPRNKYSYYLILTIYK